jgi:hypothetical protein
MMRLLTLFQIESTLRERRLHRRHTWPIERRAFWLLLFNVRCKTGLHDGDRI